MPLLRRLATPRVFRIPHRVRNACLWQGWIYASIGSALVKSADDGRTFQLIRDFPGAREGLRCIAIQGGVLFVSPEGPQLPDETKGLWRSEDGGTRWHRVIGLADVENPVSVWGLAADPEGRLFAGAYTRSRASRYPVVYRSDDHGHRWILAYFDPTGRHIHSVATDEWKGAVYAVVGDDFSPWRTKRIVRSVDGGTTWTEVLHGLPQSVGIVATPAARIFGSDTRRIAGIYRTTDDMRFHSALQLHQSLYFFWLRRDPEDGRLLAGAVAGPEVPALAGVFMSVDDGFTWQLLLECYVARKSDGAGFASAFENGRIVITVRADGRQSDALLLDFNAAYAARPSPDVHAVARQPSI